MGKLEGKNALVTGGNSGIQSLLNLYVKSLIYEYLFDLQHQKRMELLYIGSHLHTRLVWRRLDGS